MKTHTGRHVAAHPHALARARPRPAARPRGVPAPFRRTVTPETSLWTRTCSVGPPPRLPSCTAPRPQVAPGRATRRVPERPHARGAHAVRHLAAHWPRAHPTLAPRSPRARTVPNRAGRRRRSPLRGCCRASSPAPHQHRPTLSSSSSGPPAPSPAVLHHALLSPAPDSKPRQALCPCAATGAAPVQAAASTTSYHP
jgi:hypothetical protein